MDLKALAAGWPIATIRPAYPDAGAVNMRGCQERFSVEVARQQD